MSKYSRERMEDEIQHLTTITISSPVAKRLSGAVLVVVLGCIMVVEIVLFLYYFISL